MTDTGAAAGVGATVPPHRRVRLSPRAWWSHRSLRARLTTAATAVILVALAGAAAVLVDRLHASLLANLDSAVASQVQTIATEAGNGALPRLLPGTDEDAVVQVVDTGGHVVAASANIRGQSTLFRFPGGRGDPVVTAVHNVPLGDGDSTYRVAGLRSDTPAGPVTIYAGRSTAETEQSITELVGALAVGVPIIVILLALVAWLLVGRALRPVEQLRRQAAAIPGTDLHRRLTPPPADDELGRLAATLNDLLARIEVATARQRRFVADAAHELRSPLAALRAQLEIAARHPDQAALDATLADLLADTNRLSRLADDLLQLAKLDTDPRPHRQSVDLDDLLLDEVRRVRGRCGRIDVSGVSAGRVLGDPHGLSRVIQNLLDNAVRHASSTVRVQLSSDGHTVTLVVSDDGAGIPPADRGRVFERFTRLDDARSRDAGGSGLGLAIVADVVARHGGQVTIDDNHPGARFTVALPAAD